MMITIHKSPQPKIEIFDYNAPTVPAFTLSAQTHEYTQLLSYSFTESTMDLKGRFQFSIAGGDNNLFNEIQPLQIVKIYEGANTPVFIGVIANKDLSCTMSQGGVQRQINFSGMSITGLIANFQLILDIKFLSLTQIMSAETINKDMVLRINELQTKEPLKIKKFLELTWDTYLGYVGVRYLKPTADKAPVKGKAGESNKIVYDIIKNFMGNDFFEVGEAESIPVPIANTFFNQGINTVQQIWQTILAPPVYEMFSRVNEKGKTKIVVRELPFSFRENGIVHNRWGKLPIRKIKSPHLVDYSLRLSIDEVYTTFFAYIEGSSLSADQYIVIEQTDGDKIEKKILQVDEKKLKTYGMKMLQVAFRGYKKQTEKTETITNAMHKLSLRLRSWFGRLDEMYTGSIRIINDFSEKQIRCGERVSFLGGEFYVRSCDHSWSYGGTPTISLQVIRGGKYNKGGEFVKVMPEMGTSNIELKFDGEETNSLVDISWAR
ncbi:hypothetical protein DWQ65_02385 [Treponema phagedenis]|uniref:Uncharacterized protein n=2 Tax=Treponema phagedenis TaxID=162 RepID=A0A0B7GT79_TREPH|nr:hypothetical protein [Treponema phagedenis]EFW39093.1 hypothetical protein HMPREF9554_00389 [Treponema phagedenis F0421]NVP23036.1 hypothetical protein [Treponema phagedenis]QEJ94673.1 hypothetical protein FUT79_05280 [Treponema phagedenis]QEJ95208.1 hypothetical protein FUT79_08355 [Treponema phagedenis]QEJ95819.1 hypothetical protein FUT79_11835 [Treponema phagedenis]